MYMRRHLLGYHYVQGVIYAIILEHIHDITSLILSHLQCTHYGYIYTRRGSFFLFPSFAPLLSLFPSPCTSPYLLGALQLWQNCPPSYQVSCRLTLFAPPFTQSTHPFQAPGTPIAQRPTTTTLGPIRSHYTEQLCTKSKMSSVHIERYQSNWFQGEPDQCSETRR
jgi:hypothetical protein